MSAPISCKHVHGHTLYKLTQNKKIETQCYDSIINAI